MSIMRMQSLDIVNVATDGLGASENDKSPGGSNYQSKAEYMNPMNPGQQILRVQNAANTGISVKNSSFVGG